MLHRLSRRTHSGGDNRHGRQPLAIYHIRRVRFRRSISRAWMERTANTENRAAFACEHTYDAPHLVVGRAHKPGSIDGRGRSIISRTIALSPIRDTLIEGFSHFVTSMTAPIASGWSDCRVGFSPTGKRRLCTAHANSRHYSISSKTRISPPPPPSTGHSNKPSGFKRIRCA